MPGCLSGKHLAPGGCSTQAVGAPLTHMFLVCRVVVDPTLLAGLLMVDAGCVVPARALHCAGDAPVCGRACVDAVQQAAGGAPFTAQVPEGLCGSSSMTFGRLWLETDQQRCSRSGSKASSAHNLTRVVCFLDFVRVEQRHLRSSSGCISLAVSAAPCVGPSTVGFVRVGLCACSVLKL